MSAIDILEKLTGIEAHALEPLQRILLVTDGTLTEILEAAFLERIRLVKIGQRMIPDGLPQPPIGFDPREPLMERKILLQGAASGKNYAYAESLIAIERLAPSFRDELLNSDVPLGRLWLAHKLETCKELNEIRSRPAQDLGRYFACAKTSLLLERTYSVLSASRAVMAITEYFPASCS